MTLKRRLSLGAIYPDDVWVDNEAQALVDEFRRFLSAEVELVSAATYVPAVDNTTALAVTLAENGDIEEAARRLMPYEPDGFAYYCTSVSFIRGPGGDLDICKRISDATGKPATTTSTAMIEALRALDIARVSLASPYLSDVEEKFIDFFKAHGITVVQSLSLQLERGHSLVAPDEIRRLAERSDARDAQAIFVGCTGQKLAEYLDAMEAILGKPVMTANQVTSWHALRLLGHHAQLKNRGRLFASEQSIHV